MQVTIQSTYPEAPGASIDELRDLLRVEADESPEDDLLETMLLAATAYASLYLGRSLINTEWIREIQRAEAKGLSHSTLKENAILLPYPPVVTVDRVYTVDNEGTEDVVAASAYWLDEVATPAELHVNVTWSGKLRVEYTAGYGEDYTSIPYPIQRGILMHAAHLYKFRGDDCSDENAAKASGAIAAYRIYRVVRR